MGNVCLADLDLGRLVFDQEHAAVVLLSTVCDLVILINGERGVCCDRVSVRLDRLTKRICLIDLKTFHLMRLAGGYPLALHVITFVVFDCSYISFAVEDLNAGSLQFLLSGDGNLAHLDNSHGILHYQHRGTVFCLADGSGRCHFVVSVDRKLRVACNCESERGDSLVQGILYACCEAFHDMIFFCGDPLALHVIAFMVLDNNYVSFAVEDLEGSSGKFLVIGCVNLSDIDLGHVVFYEDNVSFCYRSAGSHLSFLINRECCIGSNGISERLYCLMECIRFSRCKAMYNMRLSVICGCPLINDSALCIDELDLCTLHFFHGSCINFADRYLSLIMRVFNGIASLSIS